MTILDELYLGNINPSEKRIKEGSEYQKLTHDISECERKLFETLNKEQKKIYERIFEIRDRQEDISERELFIEGFRTGAQIMLEINSEPDFQLIPMNRYFL